MILHENKNCNILQTTKFCSVPVGSGSYFYILPNYTITNFKLNKDKVVIIRMMPF